MIGRKKKDMNKKSNSDQITTVVAEGSSIEGTIMTSSARIDGSFKGEAKLYGTLIIGEKGHVKGEIHAPRVLVYGRSEGKIRANVLEIKQTGNVEGDIVVQALTVENGGIFNGNSSIKKSEYNTSQQKTVETTDSSEVASFQAFKENK